MTKFGPRRVTRAVGMNPIAQAVARKQVHDSIVSTQINLHLLEEGEPCGPLLNDIAFLLTVMAAADYSHNGWTGFRSIAEALAVLETSDDHWSTKNLGLLDGALLAANHLYKTLPVSAINTAIQNLSKGS